MKLVEGNKYQVMAAKTKAEIIIAVAPKGDYYKPGDLIKVEDDIFATVLVVNDYVEVEEIKMMEEAYGQDLRKVVSSFRQRVCDWEEE